MINKDTHKLAKIIGLENSSVYKVVFHDGEVFLLKDLFPIDPSIYDKNGLWTSEIVEIISVNQKKRKLFKKGGGLDFKEDDIQKIVLDEGAAPTRSE